ncbi:GlsB/YeaQ/YmgE family stress response membrane protein [soil metagenome]
MPLAPGIYMHILWMLIIGLVIGALAKLIMPGKDPGGAIITIIIGVVGSMLAGFLGRSLGWYQQGEAAGFIASIVGAIILLAGYRMVVGRKHVV